MNGRMVTYVTDAGSWSRFKKSGMFLYPIKNISHDMFFIGVAAGIHVCLWIYTLVWDENLKNNDVPFFYNDERANTEQRRILYLINRFLSIASERSIKWLEISAKYSIYLCFLLL